MRQNAGLLLYRRNGDAIEVLLGHLGGHFWRRKNHGAWSIPKGLIAEGETPLATARREFAKETGHRPRGKSLPLGESKRPGGKVVHVWAADADWNSADSRAICSRWNGHGKSGRRQEFPELPAGLRFPKRVRKSSKFKPFS
jgi:predicted NUDIX family NTP pyrophosphohydrolase